MAGLGFSGTNLNQNQRASRLNLLGPIKEVQYKDGEVGKVPEDLSLNLVRDLIEQSFSDDEDGHHQPRQKKKAQSRRRE